MIRYYGSPDKSIIDVAGGEVAVAIAATRPWLTGVRSRISATTRSQRPVTALAVLLGLSAATIALTPGIARSHAIIVAAQPGMNSTVPPGQLDIRLAFNSRIDSKRSNLRLQRPDGTESDVSLTPDSPPGVIAGRAQTSVDGRCFDPGAGFHPRWLWLACFVLIGSSCSDAGKHEPCTQSRRGDDGNLD